ncbi:MAG: hypothetical protein LCH76_06295 [Actinobacteria bacterium]|nr:hypothetical protein [Actinomycetota bacterium]
MPEPIEPPELTAALREQFTHDVEQTAFEPITAQQIRTAARAPGRRTATRWLAVAASVLVVASGGAVFAHLYSRPTTAVPNQTASPTTGVRVEQVAPIPNSLIPGTLVPVAGTGTRFIVEGENEGRGRYTPDDGATWQELPAGLRPRSYDSGGSFIGYGGSFVGVRQAPEPDYSYTGFQRWDPATGLVTTFDYDLDPATPEEGDDDTPVMPIDYLGDLVLLNDSRIFDLSGAQAQQVQPQLPASIEPTEVEWRGLTRDGHYVIGLVSGPNGSQLVLGALDAGSTAVALPVPGLLDVDASADRIHYLVATAGQLRACRAEAATPTDASCVTVASGDYRSYPYLGKLTTSDGADQVTLYRDDASGPTRRWLVRGGTAVAVGPQDEETVWQWLPFRDADAPVALVRSDGGPDQVIALADDGSSSALFGPPAVEAVAFSPAVAADRVLYRQPHVAASGETATQLWFRRLTGARLSEETLVTDRWVSAFYVSGDRTAVQWDRAFEGDNRVVFFDQATQTATVEPGSTTSGIRALSGPYARLSGKGVDRQVVRVDGQGYDTGTVTALFGSLVVEAGGPAAAPGRGFVLRDLARPEAEPIPIDLPDLAGRGYLNDGWLLWGDWVAASYEVFEGNRTVLFDYRTGETVELPNHVGALALGEGWALLADHDAKQVRLRVLATGEEVVIADSEIEVATDGVRTLAWAGVDGAGIGTIGGLGAPVSRLLGALGASEFRADGSSAWQPQFDLTAPTGAGTLRLADQAGTVVASIPIPAAPAGSIRGVTWDGRTDSGALAAPGDYTWTLDVDGATSVDGLRPASGTLTVTG